MSNQLSISDIKNQVNIVHVISEFVNLTKKGKEHVGLCPFHDDSSASLKVNESKQMFKCFACGEGGDVFDFLTKKGLSMKEATHHLTGGVVSGNFKPISNTVLKSAVNDWVQIMPNSEAVLSVIQEKSFKNKADQWIKLKYVCHWRWVDETNKLIGYTVRFEHENGDKEVLPLTFRQNKTTNQTQWRWLGFEQKYRKPYKLDLILNNPTAVIILVEGEKTADACQKHFNPATHVVTTWIGGANGVEKTDFSFLKDRKVILFPDNDIQGLSAMLHIKKIIGLKPNQYSIVTLNNDLPKGWDCADKSWKDNELKDYIKPRLTKEILPNYNGYYRFQQIGKTQMIEFGEANDRRWFYKELAETASAPTPTPKDEPLSLAPSAFPKKPKKQNDPYLDNFTPLGYDKSESGTQSFYFYAKKSKQVIRLSPTSMGKNLLLIAPLIFWEEFFPAKKSKYDTDNIINFLIEISIRKGIFNPDNIRGRGAWIDNNGKDVVIHCGSNLIVNGVFIELGDYESKYIYEAGYDLGFNLDTIAQKHESFEFLELCKLINWENPINAYYLAGWCVIAPVCGALAWRPHIWITGSAGTGKSWIYNNIVKKMLGDIGVYVESETTEPGLRGYLKCDARPICFDEAEGEDQKSQDRIQSVIGLMRSASTHESSPILKGAQGGGFVKYITRSCFAFSSIGVGLKQSSDKSRVTVLAVHKLFDETSRKTHWEALQRKYTATVSSEFAVKLQARTVALLPIIQKNGVTFTSVASTLLGDQRAGDQVGLLLAGAYSLVSNNEITFDQALEWLSAKDITAQIPNNEDKDEVRLITHLLERLVQIELVNGNRVERTVGELIYNCVNKAVMPDQLVQSENAHNRLLTLGFRIDRKNETVIVSNTSEFIRKSLQGTPWANNHLSILKRLKGAIAKEQTTFGSHLKSRAVEIPLSTIPIDFESQIIGDNVGDHTAKNTAQNLTPTNNQNSKEVVKFAVQNNLYETDLNTDTIGYSLPDNDVPF